MKLFLFPIAWMVMIFVLSTDMGSMDNTRSFLSDLIRLVFPSLKNQSVSTLLLITRKLAHLGEYAILALLWLLALTRGGRRFTAHPFRYALFISVFYAGLDELHHSFVESRTGSLVDVGIDSTGALLALFFWKSWQKCFHQQKK